MKDVKDIMNEMIKLSELEKVHPVIDYCAIAPEDAPDCTCEADEYCQPTELSCYVTIPDGFTVVLDDVTGDPTILYGFDQKCCTITPGEECCYTVCGCKIKLQEFQVNACLDMRLSILVEDSSLNQTYICCQQAICVDKTGICCVAPDTCEGFIITDLTAAQTSTEPNIWEITGNIQFGCDLTDCSPE